MALTSDSMRFGETGGHGCLLRCLLHPKGAPFTALKQRILNCTHREAAFTVDCMPTKSHGLLANSWEVVCGASAAPNTSVSTAEVARGESTAVVIVADNMRAELGAQTVFSCRADMLLPLPAPLLLLARVLPPLLSPPALLPLLLAAAGASTRPWRYAWK